MNTAMSIALGDMGKLIELAKSKQKYVEEVYNVVGYGADPTGKEVSDDAINKAVAAASDFSTSGSSYPQSTFRAGVVYFPPGVYKTKSINVKSGIIYRGAGVYATRFNPIGTSGYVFNRDDRTDVRLACVVFEDFTISPTDAHFAYTDKYATPPAVGGINASYSSSIYFNRVNILNIDGIGINLIECYDSYFNNLELIYIGADETKPAIGMYSGANDLTNAIHMIGVRVENCPRGLLIDGKQFYNRLLREIQFIGCKFENAPLLIKHVFGVTFSASHFTPHGEAPFTPFVVVGDAADGSDTRGVQFIGCTYISGSSNKRWMFDIRGDGTYDFKVLGGSVTGLQTFLTKTRQKVHISGLSAVTCGTPFITSTEKLRVTDCNFYNMIGGDYVINGGINAVVTLCDFEKIDKGIAMSDNCFSEHNYFKDVAVHAHYVSNGGNTITRNRDDGGVVKMIEYSSPSLNLVTFRTEQLVTPAPAGFNEQSPIGAVGLSGVYGAATSVTGNGYKYFTNPQIKTVIGGTVGGGETITLKIQANYDDGTSAFVEKAYTATGNNWLANDDLAAVVTSRLQIKSFSLFAKTSASSTSATASVKFLANLH